MIGPFIAWLLAILAALSAAGIGEPPPPPDPAPVAVAAPEPAPPADLAPCWVTVDADLTHPDEYGFLQGSPPGHHHVATRDGELVTMGYAGLDDPMLDPWGVPLDLVWCGR